MYTPIHMPYNALVAKQVQMMVTAFRSAAAGHSLQLPSAAEEGATVGSTANE